MNSWISIGIYPLSIRVEMATTLFYYLVFLTLREWVAMSSIIKARFFHLKTKNENAENNFVDVFNEIVQEDNSIKEKRVSGRSYRLETFEELQGGLYAGEIIRVQRTNLPVKVWDV